MLKLFLYLSLSILLHLSTKGQVTLDGSKSVGGVYYKWRQISGSSVILQTPDSIECNVTGISTVGIYEFEITVTGSTGLFDKDSVIITAISGALDIPTKGKSDSAHKKHKGKLNVKVYNNLKVQISSPNSQKLVGSLYNIQGQLLERKTFMLYKGENYIQFKKPEVKGIYIVSFETYFDKLSQKVFIWN